jgi:hypothetical protein
MNQEAEHLRLLSIFHYIVGGLLAFFACLPVIHLILGLVLVLKPQLLFGPGNNQPPPFIGWFFVIFASAFIVLGWTLAIMMVWAGRCLSRRLHHSFCFGMACLGCLFMPFGTVLGVFTIIVLMRPSVKALFGQSIVPEH